MAYAPSEKLSQITSIVYGALTDEQIVKFAVVKITKPSSQGNTDKASQKDKKNRKRDTPYDPRLGCLENGMLCETCKKDNKDCPGHFGYIDLPIPIYNKTYMNYILKILQCVCHVCARPRINEKHIQLTAISRLKGNKKLTSFVKRCKKIVTCPWDGCNTRMQFYHFNKTHVKRYVDSKVNDVEFKAGEALNIFMRISDETLEFLGFNNHLADHPIYGPSPMHAHKFRPESMIITKLLVIPSVARPYVVRDGQEHDDDLTDKYNSIIKASTKLREDTEVNVLGELSSQKGRKRAGKLREEDRKKIEEELQMHIWSLMNNKDEKSKLSSGGRAHKCLFQRIQGKEGIVQSNIGGKRVDFSSRSVIIGGGIFLKMNELGVPECSAKELTIPVIVTALNKDYLQDLLEKGKINRIVRGNEVKRLNITQQQKITHTLAIGDKVERQIQNGDPYPFNRQPTLKMEGFMTFKAKIIPGYAYRLGLCYTSSYNADFDGELF